MAVVLFASVYITSAAEPIPGSDELPVIYRGPVLPAPQRPDGGLMVSPGVQNIQIYRASRKLSTSLLMPEGSQVGYTYNHHHDLGFWKGRFYAVWDMGLKDEDIPPCQLVYSSSSDGLKWSEPKNFFPPGRGWNLRFYFYRASNDRMLVFALEPYVLGPCETDPVNRGYRISERDKTTLLVRELTADHCLGEIYTLIKPGTNSPPSFEQSPDAGFVSACREAYNCRLLLEQQDYGVFLDERRIKWHDGKNWPNGVKLGNNDYWTFGKAFCFFHRSDGVLVGLSKLGIVTQSRDGGETWSRPVIAGGIDVGGAKEWAQRTPDGRFAMIYPPQRGTRFPMVVTTSDDGITFEKMRVIHGEVPPQRYEGKWKDLGPQYLRGIAEWAGDSASFDKSAIWVVYSVSKEDMWISRVPVPVVADTKDDVNDVFEDIPAGPRVPDWNTYAPTWAPVRVAQDAARKNRYLELEDREPVDYARAIRAFPKSSAVTVSFRLAAAQADRGRLEIELLGGNGMRPVRVVLNDKGQLQAVDGQKTVDVGAYQAGEWSEFTLKIKDGRFTLLRDGKELLKDAAFAEPAPTVYALSLRTGEFRGVVAGEAKADMLNTEEPASATVYRVDDVISRSGK